MGARMGNLGRPPKGRTPRDDATGLNTCPVAAQDESRHLPGRDDLRAYGPQPIREAHQRQEGARARPERGLGALPDHRRPGDGRDGRDVEARGPQGGRERSRRYPCGHKEPIARGALVTTIASAIAGMRIARRAPEGATPVESGTEPAPETPEEAARSQRLSAFLGVATVAQVAGVLGLSSALEVRAVQRNKGTLSRLFS